MSRKMGRQPAGSLAFPWMTPAIYAKLHSEVDAACDEMLRMKIKDPTPEMMGQMCNRVYENVRKTYPDVDRYARAFGKSMPNLTGWPIGKSDVEMQAGGAFLALIALLLFAGFYGRRRYYGRDRRY
jgi:hypothetical protein